MSATVNRQQALASLWAYLGTVAREVDAAAWRIEDSALGAIRTELSTASGILVRLGPGGDLGLAAAATDEGHQHWLRVAKDVGRLISDASAQMGVAAFSWRTYWDATGEVLGETWEDVKETAGRAVDTTERLLLLLGVVVLGFVFIRVGR